MTPDGHIAQPLDKAAIREPFLAHRFCQGVYVRCADKADLSDRSAIYRVIEAQFRVSAAIYDAPQHLSPMRPFETNVTAQNESRHLPHVFRTT